MGVPAEYLDSKEVFNISKYPLPLITTAFELLQGATFFIEVDLHNTYQQHERPLTPQSIQYISCDLCEHLGLGSNKDVGLVP